MKRRFFKVLCAHLVIKRNVKLSKGTVLVSYIIKPFLFKGALGHSNLQEAIVIADVFNELGFNVHICDYRNKRKINYDKYQIIFGFGEHLELALKNNYQGRVIHYATGMPKSFQNEATISRLKYFYKRTGILASSSCRFVIDENVLQESFSHAILAIGGNEVKKEFLKKNKNVKVIDSTYINSEFVEDVLYNRDIDHARFGFLWLGGPGCIHKGLDLLIDAFYDMPEYHLHIVGDVSSEIDFYEKYFLGRLKNNIHYHGYQKINSESMRSIFEQCCFTILPSCSEGQATSVLNSIRNGALIPFVSEYGGNDKPYVHKLLELSSNDIKRAVKFTSHMTNADIYESQIRALQTVIKDNSISKFKSNFMKKILEIIN